MEVERFEIVKLAYEQSCASYHQISDFRAKLLALLPIATGAGVIFLDRTADKLSPWLMVGLGAFGFFITLGLFFYELRGIQRCKLLIDGGKQLEVEMGLTTETSQFLRRDSVSKPLGIIGSETAGYVVYLTLLVSWAALAAAGITLLSGS